MNSTLSRPIAILQFFFDFISKSGCIRWIEAKSASNLLIFGFFSLFYATSAHLPMMVHQLSFGNIRITFNELYQTHHVIN